ncbi:trypsin-like serine protease [Sphaerisporangium fuscum]|uniref:trypsin-like serine protease n=1 Tax=Sphaerisporangium fuscum TaxID=2835868 RepID=UPI002029A92B|nr:trypsin-like serine protease [Sphaerisporangium fuscum]
MAIGMRSAVFASLTTIGLTLTATATATATAATATATAATVPAATAGAAIIGGRPATEAYPFMAYLRKKGLPSHCGGSLIAANWIVTAAHCAGLVVPGKTKARIGSPDRLKGGTLVGYKRLVVHPGFKLPDMSKGLSGRSRTTSPWCSWSGTLISPRSASPTTPARPQRRPASSAGA